MAGEHENRTHLTVLTHGDSGFEVRDGHQLRNLSLVRNDYTEEYAKLQITISKYIPMIMFRA